MLCNQPGNIWKTHDTTAIQGWQTRLSYIQIDIMSFGLCWHCKSLRYSGASGPEPERAHIGAIQSGQNCESSKTHETQMAQIKCSVKTNVLWKQWNLKNLKHATSELGEDDNRVLSHKGSIRKQTIKTFPAGTQLGPTKCRKNTVVASVQSQMILEYGYYPQFTITRYIVYINL